MCSVSVMPSAPDPPAWSMMIRARQTNSSTTTRPGHHAAPRMNRLVLVSTMGSCPGAAPHCAFHTVAQEVAVAVGDGVEEDVAELVGVAVALEVGVTD